MPILNDIVDQAVIGLAIRKGRIEEAAAIAERLLTALWSALV